MVYVKIKPLSINCAYRGKRFKTPAHDLYKRQLQSLLPYGLKIGEAPYCITLEFGTCKSQDLDNNAKLFLDALVNKYGFDDRYIYELRLKKVAVKKGFEYVKFNIESIPYL